MSRDTIFSTRSTTLGDFAFDEQVAGVFDDMIHRSVPLYEEVQEASANLARAFVQPVSTVYDLGCSTGTTLIALCRAIEDTSIRFVGVDSSAPMLTRCREKLSAAGCEERVALIEADLLDVQTDEASVVLLNYTLQFFPPEKRLALLSAIYNKLRPGGILLVTEKVVHRQPELQKVLTALYYDFKRRNGYSELEISRKREALEDVLVPYSAQENTTLLHDAGFTTVEPYLKWFTFVSLIALK